MTTLCQVIPEPTDNEYREVAWGKTSPTSPHTPLLINRGKVTGSPINKFVNFELIYCGICHSDIHSGENDFGSSVYPFVAGHELLGKVTAVGPDVTRVAIGDVIGVGCFVDSCLNCNSCKADAEQYCEKGMVGTYNGDKSKHGRVPGQDGKTMGGYSGSHTVHEHFIIKIPPNCPLEKTAPLMCAAITMYSPLNHWGCINSPTKKTIGIIGVGGLGTMGIRIANALGHTIVAVSRRSDKAALAKQKGAHYHVASLTMTDDDSAALMDVPKCDLILNTVSANHDLNVYLPLLASNGVIVQIGLGMQPHPINQLKLIVKRQSIAGSLIGGIKETQECIDFCAAHDIYPDVEVVLAKQIDDIWGKLKLNNDSGLRYVIDVKASLADVSFLPQKE